MKARVPAYRQAQIEVKVYIEKHCLRCGDTLPSEAALAQELGISRPSLREAIKSLESLGVVESRHGEGIFVKAFTFDSIVENLPYALSAAGPRLEELLQVRAAIELGAAPAVMRCISAEDVQSLRQLAERMLEKAAANEMYELEDREFHAIMHRCLSNRFMTSLTDLFWQAFHRLNHADGQPQHWLVESTARDHLTIVEMIESRNLSGLLEAYQRHFTTILNRMNVHLLSE